MTPHVLGKNVVGSFNDALLVSNPTYGGAERVDMASLAGASWNAGYDPADADCIVNTSALVAAYKAQATASQDARDSRPTAGMSYRAADLYDLSLLARQVVDYQDQIERLQVSSRSITEQRNQWRLRAQQAEARIETATGPRLSPEEEGRYIALKHRLAKLLHPDSPSRAMEDKAACEALFAEIWTAIDQIEHTGTDSR
jgi:hypothetical protein